MSSIRFVLCSVLVASLTAGVWSLLAADPKAPTAKLPARAEDIDSCRSCHVGSNANEVAKEKYQSDAYYLLNEYDLWKAHDPHSKAYAVLDSDLGRRMSANLQAAYNRPDYSVTTDARCLTCHGVDKTPTALTKDLTPDEINARFVRDNDVGVGCIACHQTTSKAWIAQHGIETGDWRRTKLEDKKKAGMRDLRDPVVKANLCVSCHVGDPDEGKIITHEMYAAGHPALPPFDLASFVTDQPRHFRLPSEIALKTSGFKTDVPPPAEPSKDDYHSQHAVIGALTALKAEAKLLADDARKAKQNRTLDFARFDCYACHHDLKGTERQTRGYDGPPGRPPLKAWNRISGQVIEEFAGTKSFGAVWDTARQASFKVPFGDPESMEVAAKGLEDWCTTTLAAINKPGAFTEAERKKLTGILRKALADPKTLADPEAALGLLWILHAVMPFDEKQKEVFARVLPLSPRGDQSGKGPPPTTALEISKDRARKFNAFNVAEFLKALQGEPKAP